jgi:hypothetical protein
METAEPIPEPRQPPPSCSDRQTARPAPREFSVPRRYDLATLMAVTLAYACLFGALRALHAPPAMVLWVAGFLTAVGAAQALLFGGKYPRESSQLAGIAMMLLLLFLIFGAEGGFQGLWQAVTERPFHFMGMCFPCVLSGALLGYAAGVLVAGVFLVAHYLRWMLRWNPRQE